MARNTSATDATIVITDKHPSLLVDICSKEVEEIATCSVVAYSAALDWIVWRRVLGPPGFPPVVSSRYVEVPNTCKARCVVVRTALGRPEESDSRAVTIARDCCVEHAVLDAKLQTDISVVRPGSPLVTRDCHT